MVVGCGDNKLTVGSDAAPPIQIDARPPTPFEAWGLAWAEHDLTRRNALLEIALDPSIRYVSLNAELNGPTMISTVIGNFLQTGGSTGVSSRVDQHNSRARYTWYVNDSGGTTTATGRDVDALAADGRLMRIVEFWDPLPAAGTLTTVQQALRDAFNTSDPTARDALLATAVSSDVVTLMPPSTRGTTRAELSTIIGNQLAADPSRVFAFESGVLANREFWYVTWSRSVVNTTGVLAMVVAGDGTVSELVFFDGVQPN